MPDMDDDAAGEIAGTGAPPAGCPSGINDAWGARDAVMDTRGVPVDLVAEHLDELRDMARRFFRGEAPGHSRQATGLVNEMWIRLHESAGRGYPAPTSSEEFLAFASRAMRSILVEWARRRQALKRGGGKRPRSLHEGMAKPNATGPHERWAWSLLEIEEELEQLEKYDPLCAEAFSLRFFSGMTDAQVGRRLGVSPQRAGQLVRAAVATLRARAAHDTPPSSEP